MRARAGAWAGLLVVATFLSGCAGDGGEALDAGLPTDGALDGSGEGGAPGDPGARAVWTHGDWWQYEIVFDPGIGEPLINSDDKIVVSRADAAAYEVASGGRNVGLIDTEFNMFFVGRLDPDLTGEFGFAGRPFKMFDWPLTDGKAWTTEIFEFSVEEDTTPVNVVLTATAVPSSGAPYDDGSGFKITGTTPGGWTVTYTYSPAAKWFTDFSYADSTGFELLSMQLRDFGSNYTGTFVIITMSPIYERFVIVPFFVFDPSLSPVPPLDSVDVSDPYAFLLEVVVLVRFSAAVPPAPTIPGAGAYAVVIQQPNNQVRQFPSLGSGDNLEVHITYHEPYPPGEWRFIQGGAGTGVGAFIILHGFKEEVIEFNAMSHEGHTSGGG